MTLNRTGGPKPAITLGRDDYEKLTGLAAAALDRFPEVADELQSELERAAVVDPQTVPVDVVRMGSSLEYSADGGTARRVTLVYPGNADISEGKVSILTPIGAALIGLAKGQSIDWTGRDGRVHRLEIVGVEQPLD